MRQVVIRISLIVAICLGLFAAQAGELRAQTSADSAAATLNTIDYSAWQATATRAEDVLAAGRASNSALDVLRSELTGWRDRFQSAQGANQSRIDTLNSQITALGPVPESGVSEPAEIAARRTELTQQLTQLTAPRRAAEEAYTRADGLIREIDAMVRARQTDAFFELGPTPLYPALWPQAWTSVKTTSLNIARELTTSVSSPANRELARQSLPVTVLFLLVAFVLLLRGQRWMERLTRRIHARAGKRRAGMAVGSFFASLGQLALPLIGAVALVEAFGSTGLLTTLSEVVVNGAFTILASYLVARWIAGQVLGTDDQSEDPLLPVSASKRREARAFAGLLGALVGVTKPLQQIITAEGYSEGVGSVLLFPVTVLGGLILLRLGQILLAGGRVVSENDDANQTIRDTVLLAIGRGAMALGVLAPLAAAAGYTSASQGLLWPAVTSLSIIGVLVILSRLSAQLYGLLTGKDDDALSAALVPVLITFALVIAALPVFALVWGARVADLTETWTRIKAGIRVGDTTISPSNFLTFAIVFVGGYVITRLVQQALASTVLPKTRLDLGGRNAVRVGVGYLGIFLSAIVAITLAGIDLSSLAIVAGALSVGIGFGLQTIVSNFVSGIILLIERPISEGDWIKVGDQMGFVRDISVRATRIETFDRTDVIVPNADLISGQVTNYTRGNSIGRLIVPVGVAYGSDTRHVERVLTEIAEAHPMVAVNPKPQVLFVSLGADSLNFEVRLILPNITMIVAVQNDILHEVVRRFEEEGIAIPFPQRDLWLRNPEALAGLAGAKGQDKGQGAETTPTFTTASDIAESDMPDGSDQ